MSQKASIASSLSHSLTDLGLCRMSVCQTQIKMKDAPLSIQHRTHICAAVRDNTGVDGSCTRVARAVISCKLCMHCPSTLPYYKKGGAK